MGKSRIEWTDATWNPITGCTPISEGCRNCYASRMAKRLAGRCGYPADDPFRVTFHADRLDEPFHWRTPRRVFVCSMADLFHDDVQDDWLNSLFSNVMENCTRHTFMILTKRPERMRDYLAWRWGDGRLTPRNIWLGVTAENQEQADKRIPILLDTPAAARFVSIEPMIGPVDLLRPMQWWLGPATQQHGMHQGLDWVIVGGETGPCARPMHPDWARSVRDQCQAAGVPFFFKGMIVNGRKTRLLDGREWNEFPRTDAATGKDAKHDEHQIH